MKIAQLFENDIEEARRNNWGREQSHATGQQYGRELPQALPAADQQAAIQKGRAQAAQGQAQADLQARLAQHKAQKAAEPAQAAPASPLSDEEREAHKAAGGKFDPQTGAAIPLEPAAQQQQAAPSQQTGQASAAKTSLSSKVAGAAQKVGDVGSAVTGAIGNIGAGFFGGMKRGFNQQAYGTGPARPSGDATMAAARQQTTGGTPNFQQSQSADQDVAALSARVDALEKALQQRGRVAEEFKFPSKFLGKDI